MNQIIFIKNLCRTNTAGIQSAKPGLTELVDSFVLNHDNSYNMRSYTSMKTKWVRNKGVLCDSFLENKMCKMTKQKPHAAFLDEWGEKHFQR